MALWTPANLSGSKLHRWIKGSSFTTSGGSITGGTTSDSSASTITKVSTNWPTYNASGLNGHPTITSGGSNLMSIPVDIDYDCSVFVVVKPSALSSYHNVYEQSGDKSPMLWIDSSNRFSMNGAGAVIEPSTPTADGSTWRVVSTINRSSGTRAEERIDGTSKGTAGESVGSLNVGTGLTLKLLGRSDGNGLQGDVAEIVITYGALTADDEARVEGYLAWRYDLESQLDSGHAYKSAAPTDGQASLVAETGAFTLTGGAAGLTAARALVAASGSFSVSGQAAGLRAARRLAADAGAFSLAGQAAGMRVAHLLSADAGTFVLGGQAAGLSAARQLIADAGAFDLQGHGVAFETAGQLAAGTGAFVLTGEAVALQRAYRLIAAPGEFALTGEAAGLLALWRLLAETGDFELVGQDALFGLTGGSRAETGVFVLTGHSVLLRAVLATLPGRIGGLRRPVVGGARPSQIGRSRSPQRI